MRAAAALRAVASGEAWQTPHVACAAPAATAGARRLLRPSDALTLRRRMPRVPPTGKEGEGEEEEDTYDMLRKLVQLQRMTGGGGGGQQPSVDGKQGEAEPKLQPEITIQARRGAGCWAAEAACGARPKPVPAAASRCPPRASPPAQAGCTAVVALIVRDQLYVANAGDSRAVLCRGGKALPMSGARRAWLPLARQHSAGWQAAWLCCHATHAIPPTSHRPTPPT